LTQTDAKRDVTTVLEQAYRGPQALEALLARRDDDFCRPALKLALTVIRDEHNQEDLAKIERLIRRLPFPYNAKFLVARTCCVRTGPRCRRIFTPCTTSGSRSCSGPRRS